MKYASQKFMSDKLQLLKTPAFLYLGISSIHIAVIVVSFFLDLDIYFESFILIVFSFFPIAYIVLGVKMIMKHPAVMSDEVAYLKSNESAFIEVIPSQESGIVPPKKLFSSGNILLSNLIVLPVLFLMVLYLDTLPGDDGFRALMVGIFAFMAGVVYFALTVFVFIFRGRKKTGEVKRESFENTVIATRLINSFPIYCLLLALVLSFVVLAISAEIGRYRSNQYYEENPGALLREIESETRAIQSKKEITRENQAVTPSKTSGVLFDNAKNLDGYRYISWGDSISPGLYFDTVRLSTRDYGGVESQSISYVLGDSISGGVYLLLFSDQNKVQAFLTLLVEKRFLVPNGSLKNEFSTVDGKGIMWLSKNQLLYVSSQEQDGAFKQQAAKYYTSVFPPDFSPEP